MIEAQRYLFFRQHGGGIVGESARCALALARAEQLLDEALDLDAARFQWVDDEEPYDAGDEAPADVARYFDENRWTGPFGAILEVGDASASLFGVVLNQAGTHDPYARVVRAELADELRDELTAAIAAAQVRSLADDLAARVGAARAAETLRGVLDSIEEAAV